MTEQVTNDATPEQLKGMEYTYRLMKGGDGYLYVSIQPLMKDIAKSIAAMQGIDTSGMSEEAERIFDLKMLGLVTVYEFLGGFITEQQLKDKKQELSGTVSLNAGSTFVDSMKVKQ